MSIFQLQNKIFPHSIHPKNINIHGRGTLEIIRQLW